MRRLWRRCRGARDGVVGVQRAFDVQAHPVEQGSRACRRSGAGVQRFESPGRAPRPARRARRFTAWVSPPEDDAVEQALAAFEKRQHLGPGHGGGGGGVQQFGVVAVAAAPGAALTIEHGGPGGREVDAGELNHAAHAAWPRPCAWALVARFGRRPPYGSHAPARAGACCGGQAQRPQGFSEELALVVLSRLPMLKLATDGGSPSRGSRLRRAGARRRSGARRTGPGVWWWKSGSWMFSFRVKKGMLQPVLRRPGQRRGKASRLFY